MEPLMIQLWEAKQFELGGTSFPQSKKFFLHSYLLYQQMKPVIMSCNVKC